MTTPSRPKSKDNSFSSFAVGVSVGVAASLLFGTNEGRKLVKRFVDAIPDKYKTIPDIGPLQDVSRQSHSAVNPVILTQETAHHATFDSSLQRGTPWQSAPIHTEPHFTESPPPPAPFVRPSRPEPFHPQ